jgi:hypothetical protein
MVEPAILDQSNLGTDSAVDPDAAATNEAGTGTCLGRAVHGRAQLVDVDPADAFDA